MSDQEIANLVRVGQLDKVPFSAVVLRRMLVAARSRLDDSRRADKSPDTCFDCAYTAVGLVADAALLVPGLRTPSSKPGHDQTTIRCLVHTLGVPLR